MKNVLLTTAIMSAMFAGSASAHTINGGTFINNTPDAIDVYHTSCFSWGTAAVPGIHGVPDPLTGESSGPATRLRFTIRGTNSLAGNTGTNKVKLTVGKSVWNPPVGAVAGFYSNLQTTTTDTTNNDGAVAVDFVGTGGAAPAGYSAAASVNGGNGDYTLLVNHATTTGAAGTGTSGYDIILHCQAVSGTTILHTGTGSFGPGQEATQALPNGDYDQLINF